MAEQGTGPITDVAALHGDFWPEEESVEEFVAVREWRGHTLAAVGSNRSSRPWSDDVIREAS